MKILVTGGAGFIGSNFIIYWLKNNPRDEITNLDSLTYAGNLENLKDVEDNPNYTFVKGDITNGEVVDSVVKDQDLIVHFAAESHVDRSIMGPAQFVRTNVVGTQVLLDAALQYKVRFHHVSTDEVFGALSLDSKEKFNEDTNYNPRSPYSASKASSDHLVRAYYHTYGLPITITNSSNNYGPYQFPEKLIPLAITNLIEGKKVPVYGDGLYVRDWIYVEDHVKAIEMVIKSGEIGQTYCVGGLTENIHNIDVIKKITKLLGKNVDEIEYVKDRMGHDRRYAVNWSKINKKLGWKPENDFDTWLKKTVEWYKENKEWWRKIKTGEYLSYYQKQYNLR